MKKPKRNKPMQIFSHRQRVFSHIVRSHFFHETVLAIYVHFSYSGIGSDVYAIKIAPKAASIRISPLVLYTLVL